MKIRHVILVAVFALLQGLAPLLHAHMGADRTGASGVHMHAGLHAARSGDSSGHFSDAGPLESQVVGLGQEIRRDRSWQPVGLAHAALPVWGDASRGAQEPPSVALDAAPAQVSPHLLPPAQAPPRATT